jgi:hypothetical protein
MTLQAITAGWAALMVVLTGATQLRIPGLPIGPGELMLVGWSLFVGCLLLCRGIVGLGPQFRVFLMYWLLAFALLGLGALVAAGTGRQDPNTTSHDALAFGLAAVASCLFGLRWHGDQAERFHLKLARLTFFICTTVTTVLLIVAQVSPTLGSISLWYAGLRFRGWALNPNQMALFVVTMPFLGWYLMQYTHKPGSRLAYLVGIGGAIAVGIATQSDALRLAWAGTSVAVGSILWVQSLMRGRGRFLFVSYFLVPFLLIYFGTFFGHEIIFKIDRVVEGSYDEFGQGEDRMRLWSHGLDAIQRSPVVGFGPGAYSGQTGPLQGGEAHNSLIDWGMSTGILGVALHVALLAWCARQALRVSSLPLLAIVMALTLFSLLHYMLRQPLYWLILALVLILTERRDPQQARAPAIITPGRLAGRPAMSRKVLPARSPQPPQVSRRG